MCPKRLRRRLARETLKAIVDSINRSTDRSSTCVLPDACIVEPGPASARGHGGTVPMIVLLVVAVAHYGLAQVLTLKIASPFEVSLLWLPMGLGVAACLALGARAAIAVFFAALANNLHYDTTVEVAILIAMATAAQSLATAWLLGRWSMLGAFAPAGLQGRCR